jgi:hypothetical protein
MAAHGGYRSVLVVSLLAAAWAATAQPLEAGPPEQWQRTIAFSGRSWAVKASPHRVGPGSNFFSDSPESVWVDEQGRLHLRIAYRQGVWQAAEVSLRETLGYGTYAFTLGPVDGLDDHVVLGLFTWSDDPAESHREVDIEVSRWGMPDNDNAQCVVQPYSLEGNLARFDLPPGLLASRHSFRWEPGRVTCVTRGMDRPDDPGQVVHTHRFTGWVPQPGGEKARINLWLTGGSPPTDGRDQEVVISRFSFEPLPATDGH